MDKRNNKVFFLKKHRTNISIVIIFSEILVSIILATILMIFIYSLPTDNCIKNLKKSVNIYEQEGNYPNKMV